jgi:hypothetical protein
MARDWTVEEDVVLKRLLNSGGVELACSELGRPKTAIEMRIKFLADHSIIVGEEGAMFHRYHMPHSMGDPPIYRSALGQRTMNLSNV